MFTTLIIVISSIVFSKLICYLFDIHNNRSWLVVAIILLVMNIITFGVNGPINSAQQTTTEVVSEASGETSSE